MSTSVLKEEWPTLTMVPEENWGYRWRDAGKDTYTRLNLGKCDVEPDHGWGKIYMQTPDKRGIVLCNACLAEVGKAKGATA